MKILFISSGLFPDYQNDMVFHGLKSKFGSDVSESKDIWFMYNDITTDQKKGLYGKGFTLYGNLDPKLRNVENEQSLPDKIKSKYYDLIIYGSIHRDGSYLKNVLKVYPKDRIIFIDGEDGDKIIKKLTKVGLYFKRELIDKYNGYKVFPLNFAIPKDKIVNKIPEKTKEWATIVPGDMKTYIFDSQTDYYLDYQRARYGITTKKSGWDCLRHYEILANGCIPFFPDLEACPPKTLTFLPKEIIIESNRLIKEKLFTDERYNLYLSFLLDWTRHKLTTEALVDYIISFV